MLVVIQLLQQYLGVITSAAFCFVSSAVKMKKIDKLSTQVEELKSWLESEKNPKQSESSEVKHQKLEETVNIPNQIQKSMNRLEEKLTNIESDNKVLHQQASTIAAQLESIMAFNADVAKRPQKSSNKKQQEYEDLLIQCISQHLGFSKCRPVAACIIYKCLQQWRSFEEERTTIFDRIILTIGQAIETQGNNNCVLAYWLSNASTLLLLRHTLEQVETKCPASIFEKQLTFYVEKIYGMIRDNLKREITPLLSVLAIKSIMLDHEEVHEQLHLQDGRSYECMYCKHGFTTAQALGGHMNVHRKDRAKSRSNPSKSNTRLYQPCVITRYSPQEGHTREFMSTSSPIIYDNINHGKHENPNGLITSTPSQEEMRLRLSLSLQFGRSHEEESIQEGNENDEVDLELRLGYDP
ncbi:hypothetical protein L2E82_13055 [Cichorium intybus]|uniref:Uncharacterized protein n=1 Tax=Cichorium intybus TaxID=13427 RepID=A0ACB9GH83_CICIN|nr:hypothetical protein L2E82_13055 [Cichorium intybus]